MTAIWVILAILMIGIMILVHELGHFAVGRLCGIGVEEFSIGFGPKLLGWRRKEIDYSLRAIPLGGYVRFAGEDADSPEANAFNNHPVWKRFLTVAAGASMNFVLAFAAILLLFMLYGGVLSNLPELYSVEPGSPAELAGLLPGDQIVSVDGTAIAYDEEGFNEMYELFGARQDAEPMLLGVERKGERFDVSVSKAQDAEGRWLLGVTLGSVEKLSFPMALQASGEAFVGMSGVLLDFLKNLVFHGEGADQVTGTVGAIGQASQMIQQGFDMVLNIFASISLNLGIMNLLPLPALDGGRLVFLAIEGIFRKPVPRDKEGMVHAAGMILLFGLMIVLTYSDIMKMIGG